MVSLEDSIVSLDDCCCSMVSLDGCCCSIVSLDDCLVATAAGFEERFVAPLACFVGLVGLVFEMGLLIFEVEGVFVIRGDFVTVVVVGAVDGRVDETDLLAGVVVVTFEVLGVVLGDAGVTLDVLEVTFAVDPAAVLDVEGVPGLRLLTDGELALCRGTRLVVVD